jgi:putative transposase
MRKIPAFPDRQSIRLKGFDYSSAGFYFITICCHDREPWFGHIEQKCMVVNRYGQIIRDSWHELVERNRHVHLDQFMVMPDHFHGLISIETDIVGDTNKPIGRLMAAFKTVSCKRIRILSGNPQARIWQRNYWERIVRTEQELEAVRLYIRNNPKKTRP